MSTDLLTPTDYVAHLTRKGVRLWIDAGQLRYHARKGVLSADELAQLRAMRIEVTAELTAQALSPHEAPISFQQHWFLKSLQEHPDWRATLSYTFHLKGSLDAAVLEASLAGVLHLHGSLRTKVVGACGQWRQHLATVDGFRLTHASASGKSEEERQESARMLVRETCRLELDPGIAPVMSAQLIRVSALEHFLVISLHRLATDCLGTAQALRDLWSLYAERVTTGPSTRKNASTSYRDYALEQRSTDAQWRQKHAAYWHAYLAGATPVVWAQDTGAAPAGEESSGQLASLESSLGTALSGRLRELSHQAQTLPALVLLALYVSCLSKWCGRQDLVIPFLLAGRAAAHEGLVGCFSHIVYLRIRLQGAETFAERLKRVSNEFYKAAAFREDSGRMVTERPELLRGVLCQWLSWHPADAARIQSSLPGLEVKTLRCQGLDELTNAPPALVDLEMNFFDTEESISALAIYRTRRFTMDTVTQWMKDLRAAAEDAVRE